MTNYQFSQNSPVINHLLRHKKEAYGGYAILIIGLLLGVGTLYEDGAILKVAAEFYSFIMFNIFLFLFLCQFKSLHNVSKSLFLILGNLSSSLLIFFLDSLIYQIQYVSLIFYLLSSVVLYLLALSLLKDPVKQSSNSPTAPPKIAEILLVFMMFITSRAIFWKSIPFYTTLNTDTFTHLTAIKGIFINHNLSWNLTRISPSFSVFSYLPVFHLITGPVLAAVGYRQMIYSINIFDISFGLLSGLGIFYILRNKGFIVALIGVALHFFMFESISAYTSFFFLPQTLAAFLGFILFADSPQTRRLDFPTILYLSVIVLTHFFIGTIIALLFFMMYLMTRQYSPRYVGILILCFFILLSASIITGKLDLYEIVNIFFGSDTARDSEILKVTNLDMWTSLLEILGVFIVPTAFMVLFSPFRKNSFLIFVSATLIFLLATILSGLPYAGKLFVLLHYFLILLFAESLTAVMKSIQEVTPAFIFTALFVMALIPNLLYSTQKYKTIFTQSHQYILANQTDIELIDILTDLKKGKLISDPLTSTILEAQSAHESFGGIYTSLQKRIEIWLFLNESTTKDTFIEQLNLNGINGYVIIAPRTLQWKDETQKFIIGYANLIWQPESSLHSSCDSFNSLGTLVYSSNTACVFEL